MGKIYERWVVKAGSQMVCEGGPLLIKAWMMQVARLRQKRIELLWVTSGAIASAVERTKFSHKKRTLPEKQALSAIGQPLIMDMYNEALNSVGLLGAQVLLTADDIAHQKRKKNLKNTLNHLLSIGVVPILNENDAVSTEEIQFGDNDSLSARVARLMGAHRLIILTDVDGLYDKDPKRFKQAKLITELNSINATTLALAPTGAKNAAGTGGMHSKLLAAKFALASKIDTWLVRGDSPHILEQIDKGTALGTRITTKISTKMSRRGLK